MNYPTREFSLHGANFVLNTPDVFDLVARDVANGSFEEPMPLLLMKLAALFGGTMLDIGANNGIYSILACAVSPAMRTIAFEPYPPVHDILVRNIASNNLQDRVAIRHIALSDVSGRGELFIPDDRHGALETSCSLNPNFKPFVRSVTVPKYRLDDLVLALPSLVKLDVEGHEPEVLAGGAQLFAAARPIIFVEVLGAVETTTINAMADTLGLRRYRLRHNGVVLREDIVQYDLVAWNHVLVPTEKVEPFEAAVAAAGIPMN